MYGHHSARAEDRSGNVIPKISSGIPRRRKGAELSNFGPGAPNGDADPGQPIGGQMGRVYFNDPNPQDDACLKNRAQKHRRIFSQHPNPDRARLSPKRDPTRRASRKCHDRPVSLEAQFDLAVGGEPSGCALNGEFRFVNQCLQSKPLFKRR